MHHKTLKPRLETGPSDRRHAILQGPIIRARMQRRLLPIALPLQLPVSGVSIRKGFPFVLPFLRLPVRCSGARVFCSQRAVSESQSMSQFPMQNVAGQKRRIADGQVDRTVVEQSKQKKVLSLRTSNARSARSISYIQILGTGMDTGDTSPCVLLFFDSKRFLFNAGEGLQRFCQENRIKLSKIDHVLLTRVCSETAGGLAGTLLTLAGDVALTINIWGPSDLQFLVTAMSTFLPNASFFYTHAFGREGKLIANDGEDSGIAVLLEDELVKISAVLLLPSLHDHQGEGQNSVDFKPGDVAVVYVCELPEVKGKFDPSKAAALGLRPGRKYAQLQDGCSVLSDDGKREIFPSDVMEAPSPGPTIILVDCPTISHIQSLLTASGLERFYKHEGGSSKTVACVVHMSPAMVVGDNKYQEWMENFGPTEHIFAGSGCCSSSLVSPILKSSAKILSKLNYVCPYVFPVSGFEPGQSEEKKSLLKQNEAFSVAAAKNLLKFRLRPLSALGLDASSVPEEFTGKMVQEQLLEELPEMSTASKQVKELWSTYNNEFTTLDGPKHLVEEPWLNENTSCTDQADDLPDFMKDIPETLKVVSRKEMELVFLGTGSSQPSTCRNVSAIYMHLFEKGGMLLDCGEGTYGQLIRRFGAEGADSVLAGLKCIWISHIHADHHAGLARILSVRRRVLAKVQKIEPLLVVGPKLLKRVLEAYEKLEDLEMEFLDCSQTTLEAADAANSSASNDQIRGLVSSSIASKESDSGLKGQMRNYWLQPGFHLRSGLDEAGRSKLKNVLVDMGLASLVSVPVIHCPHAFGVVIEAVNRSSPSRPGWKLAYSGDTRPCKEFIEASRGATVFIHEATFDDGMAEEALLKKHSSTEEAIRAGASAEAYRIILTHFSQRYSKVPVFDESYNDRTCIAFDLMSINLADLPVLPALVPVLKLLFKDEQPEEEADEE